jgi:hypothetical protein
MRSGSLRLLLVALVAATFAAAIAPRAGAETVTLAPTSDLGLPFWCDWSYDWEARCHPDEGERLPVGGVEDKVWRSALRFDLETIPPNGTITSATLRLFFDGMCVAPHVTVVRCPARSYTVDAHRVLSADWFDEREPDLEFGPAATATLPAGVTFRWLAWNLTPLVRGWHSGGTANNGVALKLADRQEDFDSSGPYLLSSRGPDAARPRLVVLYTAPTP